MPSDTDALVLRYLHKRGYAAAFRALLTESGATDEFDPAEPAPRAALGALATLCCDKPPPACAPGAPSMPSTPAVPAAAVAFARAPLNTLEGLHTGNMTCVRWCGDDRLLTASADKTVALSRADATPSALGRVQLAAGVVSLDVHADTSRALVGCMDG